MSTIPQIRLVKLASDVLPSEKRIAIIDASEDGVSIGRDRVYTPRLRLPAIEVSKHHAIVFYDAYGNAERGPAFCITDTGSSLGTFVKASADSDYPREGTQLSEVAKLPTKRFTRLSEPKQSSQPIPIYHGDLIRIAASTFQVHEHYQGIPCTDCQLKGDGSDEIWLRAAKPVKSTSAERQASYSRGTGDRKNDTEVIRRQQMKDMRAHYLPKSSSTRTAYKDRAAERRAVIGSLDEPRRNTAASDAGAPAFRSIPSVAVLPAQPSSSEQPLDATNKGYQMLAKMGHRDSAGPEPSHREPIEVRTPVGRAGLGSQALLGLDQFVGTSTRDAQSQGRNAGTKRSSPYDDPRAAARRRYEDASFSR